MARSTRAQPRLAAGHAPPRAARPRLPRLPRLVVMVVLLVAVVVADASDGAARTVRLWSASPRRLLERNERLRLLGDAAHVELHWEEALEAMDFASAEADEGDEDIHLGKPAGATQGAGRQVFLFELPDGQDMECEMRASPVLPAALRRRVPGLRAVSGPCLGGGELEVLSGGQADTMSARVVTAAGETLYVDSAQPDSNVYVVYKPDDASATTAEDEGFSCGVHDAQAPPAAASATVSDRASGRRLRGKRRELQSNEVKALALRLVLIPTQGYSSFHGNTVTSVMASLLTAVSRVNGIFSRELGVYFTLYEKNDRALCLSGSCSKSFSPTSAKTLRENGEFLEERGIGLQEYDVGHSVTTSGGGIASYPGVCDANRFKGTTGSSRPHMDSFYVDFLAHELGHQLLGAHSFRDCGSNRMWQGSVEPGSGTTIMSYAGLCGSLRNVQNRADPYLNSNNVQQMREFLEKRVGHNGCGRVIGTGRQHPSVSLADTQCTVPLGNFVQLRGQSSPGAGAGSTLYHAFDRVDSGQESYPDTSVARFRAWRPTPSRERTLPNMYYLVHGLEDEVMEERLPTAPQSMTFRFSARSHFNPSASEGSFSALNVGGFAYKDVRVNFENVGGPLRVSNAAALRRTSIVQGQELEITWDVGGTRSLSSQVQILFARDTMPEVVNWFRADRDTLPLDWIEAGTVPNSGSARVVVPTIVPSGEPSEVHLMVRSVGTETCAFFDLVERLRTAKSDATPLPPPSPPSPPPPPPPQAPVPPSPPSPSPPSPSPPSPSPSPSPPSPSPPSPPSPSPPPPSPPAGGDVDEGEDEDEEGATDPGAPGSIVSPPTQSPPSGDEGNDRVGSPDPDGSPSGQELGQVEDEEEDYKGLFGSSQTATSIFLAGGASLTACVLLVAGVIVRRHNPHGSGHGTESDMQVAPALEIGGSGQQAWQIALQRQEQGRKAKKKESRFSMVGSPPKGPGKQAEAQRSPWMPSSRAGGMAPQHALAPASPTFESEPISRGGPRTMSREAQRAPVQAWQRANKPSVWQPYR